MPDHLSVENGKVTVITEEGKTIERSESDLRRMVEKDVLPPLNGTALPDGIKFVKWQAPVLVIVHQRPPHVRKLRWIKNNSPKDFGPGTKYQVARLSLPYSITFAAYHQCGEHIVLCGSNELYFRNKPLHNLQDQLGYPALLNISRIQNGRRDLSWICTQHLKRSSKMDWPQQLECLLEHTWDGAFNRSSERHEGESMYGFSEGVHPDLHPIEKWCKATDDNEAFALGVKWKPVPNNVGQLIDCMLDEQRAGGGRPHIGNQPQPASLVAQFINFTQTTPAKG